MLSKNKPPKLSEFELYFIKGSINNDIFMFVM